MPQGQNMKIIDSVAFILLRNKQVLAEKRKITKIIDPGRIVIPGGHIEKGESHREAVSRELLEELAVVSNDFDYLCTLLQGYRDFTLRINYYIVHSWHGKIQSNEAEKVFWIPLSKINKFSLEIDKVAIREFLRLHSQIKPKRLK